MRVKLIMVRNIFSCWSLYFSFGIRTKFQTKTVLILVLVLIMKMKDTCLKCFVIVTLLVGQRKCAIEIKHTVE